VTVPSAPAATKATYWNKLAAIVARLELKPTAPVIAHDVGNGCFTLPFRQLYCGACRYGGLAGRAQDGSIRDRIIM